MTPTSTDWRIFQEAQKLSIPGKVAALTYILKLIEKESKL